MTADHTVVTNLALSANITFNHVIEPTVAPIQRGRLPFARGFTTSTA